VGGTFTDKPRLARYELSRRELGVRDTKKRTGKTREKKIAIERGKGDGVGRKVHSFQGLIEERVTIMKSSTG